MKRVQVVLLLSGLISPLTIVAAAKPVETEKKKDAQQAKIDHALYEAALQGRNDEVRDLLEKGADINTLYFGYTPLMQAASKGYYNTVQLLLDRGAKPNLKNNYGRTALMYAASQGHSTIVRLLESKGASVFERDIDDRTAATIARERGHLGLYQYLHAEEVKAQQARGLIL